MAAKLRRTNREALANCQRPKTPAGNRRAQSSNANVHYVVEYWPNRRVVKLPYPGLRRFER